MAPTAVRTFSRNVGHGVSIRATTRSASRSSAFADAVASRWMVARDVQAMTMASMAWCRWSSRFFGLAVSPPIRL
jgi:hypothetical protein